ncbi:hypothetical protein AVEN_261298-1 [Araneus ventricosus]|uniref:Uncharacterized protein n=1 Tax=Araneus ventricosus TaxID=182803 RepID=A0A4Y2UJM1_ARAVE|nr:hypothetical protein AVEN_261298-1 [Araneus ventricosus]
MNLNSLLTTLGIPLFRLPESTSHLAQIAERAKSQRESEAKRINPDKSHPKTKINLEGNKLNSTPKTSPKEKVAVDSPTILATPLIEENEVLPTPRWLLTIAYRPSNLTFSTRWLPLPAAPVAADNSVSPEQPDLDCDDPSIAQNVNKPRKRRPPFSPPTPKADFGEIIGSLPAIKNGKQIP